MLVDLKPSKRPVPAAGIAREPACAESQDRSRAGSALLGTQSLHRRQGVACFNAADGATWPEGAACLDGAAWLDGAGRSRRCTAPSG